ncbi:MAG: hypothetical protein IPK82_09465 [Polyangiaceae bacterium]|nr:hypothetical protein [Polyangiaceae bacterium]
MWDRTWFSCTIVIAGLSGGCAPPSEPPQRDCAFTAWAKSKERLPTITGDFLGWEKPGAVMGHYGDDWHSFTMPLAPGEYGYLITDDEGTHVDRYNAQRTYYGETEVSLARGIECNVPLVEITSVEAEKNGSVTVTGQFYSIGNVDGGGELFSVEATSKSGALTTAEVSPDTGTFVLKGSGFGRGKHRFEIVAKDNAGRTAEAPLTQAWVDPVSDNWNEGILYQVVVDRFRADDGGALADPQTPGLRAGGTLNGVRAALEEGYFDKLGVSAIWLSPVYENAAGLLEGRDGEMYEAFHGYWVLKSREVEALIGGRDALNALIDAAHARGIKVLFDFVPNHVYEGNERYVAHQNDGWFNNGPNTCVCGIDPGCDWGSRILDCWFAPYLPDVRWQSSAATTETLNDLRYWMTEFNADGIRIDAVPMMPRQATRRMAEVLRSEYAPKDSMFSIGEVFTGPGSEGTAAIKYFLGPDGIHGAFDFPLAWIIRSVIGLEWGGFYDIENTLLHTEDEMRGSGSVLGLMVDNHDMARFVSEATGNGGSNAWFNPAPQPTDNVPYEKLKLALSLVMTLPGLPVLYYGTEVGLAGGTDPDNRRVLPGETALSASQESVLATLRRLGSVRACSSALKRGDRKAFLVAEHRYGFVRNAPDESAIVLLSNESETAQIVPPLEAVPKGAYVDVFSGETFEVGAGAPISLPARSFRILLPENSPCRSDSIPSP